MELNEPDCLAFSATCGDRTIKDFVVMVFFNISDRLNQCSGLILWCIQFY